MNITGKTYFISGHIDITEEQFNKYYRDKIIEAASNPNNKFVIGSAPGVDYMTQQLLVKLLENEPGGLDRISVYHRGKIPETLADCRLKTIGGFASHDQKDSAMTMISDIDIAYVRSEQESKKLYGNIYQADRISSTQKNLIRRSNKYKILI
jgi:predicted house-cleaning noncanonical NTP pyrophosphatase (MazG superfamily)